MRCLRLLKLHIQLVIIFVSSVGCSSFSQYPDMDGVYPDKTENSCIAQSGEPAFTNPAERSGLSAFLHEFIMTEGLPTNCKKED